LREKNEEKNKYRIHVSLLILFGVTASADHHGDGPAEPCHMYYPNIPGEMLLDNDKLVVQRFIIEPGQWEGIHRHPANQLFIHIKGGEWTVKYGDDAETSLSPDSGIGWSDTSTELTEKHLPVCGELVFTLMNPA
jgi:predicted metal-dependent enzyme (double-stranded beta helix superfamily)